MSYFWGQGTQAEFARENYSVIQKSLLDAEASWPQLENRQGRAWEMVFDPLKSYVKKKKKTTSGGSTSL